MKRNEQISLIKQAFTDIPDLQDGWKDVKETLLRMNLEQERRHRRNETGIKFSSTDAAKLFVVKHLLDGFREPNRFTVDDILSIRNEVLYAQAWANKFHKELEKWAEVWGKAFEQVDYAELMRRAA